MREPNAAPLQVIFDDDSVRLLPVRRRSYEWKSHCHHRGARRARPGGRGHGSGARRACRRHRSCGPQAAATPDRIEIGGVDLSDSGQAKKAIDAAAAHFGRLDALVNIAGGFTYETVADGEIKSWQRMHALNLLTALYASHAAIPHL